MDDASAVGEPSEYESEFEVIEVPKPPTAQDQVIKLINSMKDLSKEEKEAAIKEATERKVFRVMACGLTGAGKSTILNGLVGREVFKEGHTLSHETTEITPQVLDELDSNAQVIVYDTPGFNDDSGNEEEYVKNVQEECKDIDALIYCVSAQSPRAVMDNDASTLKKLKSALDDSVWDNCVVILTFANCIVTRLEQKKKKNIKSEYEKVLKQWREAVRKAFKEANIKPTTAIPILPAGQVEKPSLFDDSRYWLSDIWFTVHERASLDGKIVLIYLNHERINLNEKVDPRTDFLDKEIYDQPIVTADKNWLIRNVKEVGITAGVGGAAGVTGATVGAVIGALAIGIPSFGIAAGLGLLLGAGVGCGVGVGASALTATIISKVKNKK